MAAGDDTLGGQDLAVSNGQARTFRFVRAGGFSGTWTAVAGPTLTFDLTVTTDGADRLVVIPAANEALLGKPWRFRRNGVDKVGGTIQVLRPTDPAGDGTVTFTDADAVTITCSVVGGDNAGEIAVTEGMPPLWDPDTVEARYDTIAGLFGLDPGSADVAAARSVVVGVVTDDDSTVEGRLNNAEALDVVALAGDVLRDRQITAAAAHVHSPPTEAHLLVGSTPDPYTERRWVSDFEHDFTTDAVIQFEIDAELVDVQGNPNDVEEMYPEWLTRTGDNGAGAIDDVEISPETSTVTGRSLLFLEGTPDGYATEIGSLKAPMSGRARWIVEIAQLTGVWRILREAQGGSETYRGRFYLEVGRKEWGEPTQMVAHGTDPYWYIGRSLGTSRIFYCEVFEDGVGVFGPDIASAVDGATVVDDLHKVAGQWDADGSAEVVVPASSGSGPDLSDATPAALGVAAAGVSADASRADHVHALPELDGLINTYTTGDWLRLGHPLTVSTSALTSGRIYYTPIWVPDDLTIDRMALTVTSGSTAASVLTVGLYTALATGRPGMKISTDWGTLAADANATPEAAVSRTLTRGRYFLACFANSTPTVRTVTNSLIRPRSATASTVVASSDVAYIESSASSLPATATPSASLSAFAPIVAVRTA